MAGYVPVDVYVADLTNPGQYVEGVLVKVFDEEGKKVYGQVNSNADGLASFLLYAPRVYQVRAYKFQVGIQNPIIMDVSETLPNTFTINAHPVEVVASTDPRICMCSGHFRTPSLTPARGVDIYVINKFSPLLVDNTGVLTERSHFVTDKNGYVCMPLIRCGLYDVIIEGYEDMEREIAVPDAPSCNFPNLLFKTVGSVSLDAGSYEVRRGQTIEITPQVYTTTDELIEGTGREDVTWTVSDDTIASLTVEWDKLTLYGNARGTTTLRATRSDSSIVRIPDPPLTDGIQIRVL